MKPETPRPVHLKDYRPPAYLIDRVNLDVSLEPARTRVRSKLAIRPNPNAGGRREPLKLDGAQLELVDIALDGKPLGKKDFKLTDVSLTLAKTPSVPFTLEITTFVNPEANKALQGIYRSNNVYTSQCEAQGFRRITYFLDRPDVLATYTVRIDADPHAAPILLSNGNLQERGTLDGGKRHYAVWHDPHPKPCYLFALVGGDLAPISSTFRTMSGRNVHLAIYVEHGKQARAAWAMDSLKRSMRWDEQRFGREYDLDVFNIVAVSDFNMGAMENKGLNIFNDRLILASPETATDTIFEAIESVVAHEYFHNWTGNRITCRDWFQLCLKEGLTVYRDEEFTADERSATVQRIIDVRALKTHQFAEDAGPLSASRAPRELHRDQQLLYVDGLREGRRGRAHDRHHPRPRRLPQRHGPLLRPPRRAGGDGRAVRHLLRGRQRRRSGAVQAVVLAGRHAGDRRQAALRQGQEVGATRCRADTAADTRPGDQEADARPHPARPARCQRP